MNKKKHKIIIAVTGASGAIYTQVLFDKLLQLKNQIDKVGVILSDNAKFVWEEELRNKNYKNYPFQFYKKNDFMAPFASGSAQYNTMIICPSSMGTMSRIANGISDDLITRSADVILKERRKLIIVARETPLSLIHLNNMKAITESGGIICPAVPSFYSNPKTFEELASTVVDRVLTLAGFKHESYSWQE